MEVYTEESCTTNEENLVQVYIEIEQFSNIKYEYNKQTNELEIDRILIQPYIYPYAYGFILNTLAEDGDELDILIISESTFKNDMCYKVYIIGALDMEDEKGRDQKVLCVFDDDYDKIKDISDLSDGIKENIHSFFANYKKEVPGKWSTVAEFMNKTEAVSLYNKSKIS